MFLCLSLLCVRGLAHVLTFSPFSCSSTARSVFIRFIQVYSSSISATYKCRILLLHIWLGVMAGLRTTWSIWYTLEIREGGRKAEASMRRNNERRWGNILRVEAISCYSCLVRFFAFSSICVCVSSVRIISLAQLCTTLIIGYSSWLGYFYFFLGCWLHSIYNKDADWWLCPGVHFRCCRGSNYTADVTLFALGVRIRSRRRWEVDRSLCR